MQEFSLSPTQYILVGALAGGVLGFLFGLLPLVVGAKRGWKKLGAIGLAAATVSGMLSGILSLVVVAVFLVLILRKPVKVAAEE